MGSGFKTFTAGSVLTASDVNNYLMEQSVMVFANAAARDAAITAPERGMIVFLSDSGSVLVYYGATTGWRPPWNQAWGTVSAQTYSTQQTGNFTQTYSVDIVLNRRYMLTMTSQFRNNTDACGINFSSVFDGTTSAALTATVPGANREMVANMIHFYTAGSTKTANVGFTISLANGGVFTFNPTGFAPTYFTVQDIGPATTTAPAS